jgi:hypothetical protein
MKAMLLAFGFAAPIVAAAIIGVAAPAQAQNYPWCAYYGMGEDGGGTNCGFVSFEQCMATLSGMGGFCNRNTQYQPPAGPVRQRHARHKQPRYHAPSG